MTQIPNPLLADKSLLPIGAATITHLICPFCKGAVLWRTIADSRAAEFVAPWRRLECVNQACLFRPGAHFQTETIEKYPDKAGWHAVKHDKTAEFEAAWAASA